MAKKAALEAKQFIGSVIADSFGGGRPRSCHLSPAAGSGGPCLISADFLQFSRQSVVTVGVYKQTLGDRMNEKNPVDLAIYGISAELNELCDYADNSVISRTLINKPAGTATFFSFFKGQGLSEHTTPYDALVLVTEGKADITLGNKVHTLSKGETIIMPATVPHSLNAPENFKMLLIMIKSA